MDKNIFLMPFLFSFSVATIFLVVIVNFFHRKKNMNQGERVSQRHIHQFGISRFGGVAIILSFVGTLFFDKNLVVSSQLFWVIMASLMILVFGILDDIRQLSWKKQLFFQVAIALFVFQVGIRLEYVTNPFGGIFLFENIWGYALNLLLVVFWILLIMNAMNWVDGIDGVSGGISIIGASAIFLVALRPEVNQPPVAIITSALIGSILAFVVFNFNPAKILAGTSGAVFMGFILAILALFAGAKIATTLLVLAVPVIDALWVAVERFSSHESVFEADRRHLHHRLLEFGWSQKKICIFYWFITILIAIMALNFGAIGKALIFFGVSVLMISIYMIIRRKRAII